MIRVVRQLGSAGLLIAGLGLAAYLPGFWWGAPTATAADRVQSWAVDDETPLGPLAELHNILHPKPDRNLGYPLFYDFLAAGAYAPYLGFLAATGNLHGSASIYPFGLADPVASLRTLSHIAHFVTVLLAILVVLGAFDLARTLWGPPTGTFAALFVLTLYPMFYYGRTGNVDVPMLALLSLALAALARGLVHGMTARRAAWIGGFAGLALATKEAAFGALLPAGIAVLFSGRRSGSWKAPAVALTAALVTLGLGSGLLVDPHRWLAHVRFIGGRVQDIPNAETLTSAFPFTWPGNLAFIAALLKRLTEAMSLPGLLLAGGGLLLTRRDRHAAWFALALASYLVMEFLLLRSAQLRYMLPAAFLLALFAGRAAALGWRATAAPLRLVLLASTALALGLQLLRGASLTYEMLHDSRITAGQWLAEHLHPGDRVEYFGASQKLPPLSAAVEAQRATPYFGMWGRHPTGPEHAQRILDRWRRQPPRYVLVIPDHSSRPGAPFDASLPPALYDSLVAGSAGFRLATLIQTPPPVSWLRRPPLDYPSVNPPIRVFERIRP